MVPSFETKLKTGEISANDKNQARVIKYYLYPPFQNNGEMSQKNSRESPGPIIIILKTIKVFITPSGPMTLAKLLRKKSKFRQ